MTNEPTKNDSELPSLFVLYALTHRHILEYFRERALGDRFAEDWVAYIDTTSKKHKELNDQVDQYWAKYMIKADYGSDNHNIGCDIYAIASKAAAMASLEIRDYKFNSAKIRNKND